MQLSEPCKLSINTILKDFLGQMLKFIALKTKNFIEVEKITKPSTGKPQRNMRRERILLLCVCKANEDN